MKMPVFSLVMLCFQAILVEGLPGTSQGEPVVDLGYSTYKGVRLNAGVDQYLGMRYAAPPVGNLRFRAPQDPPRTNSTQNAFKVRDQKLQPITHG